MNILITNDDGINAPGIIALAKEISKENKVIIVAPKDQKSASSHSISIHSPIKIKEEFIEGLDCKAYSVSGTPADCTQVGLSFLKENIELVISGINKGPNVGTDILYSGTVSAAIEGTIYGIPSIAVSMDVEYGKDNEDYSKAVKWALNIPISYYESPHYRDTEQQKKIISEYFQFIYEPYDYTKKNIYKPDDSHLFVPTPLGRIADPSTDTTRMVNTINEGDADTLNSFYYHPSIEIDYINFNLNGNKLNVNYDTRSPLQQIVKALKDNDYTTVHIDNLINK